MLWRVNLGELILADIQGSVQGGGQGGVQGGGQRGGQGLGQGGAQGGWERVGQGGEGEGSGFSDDYDWIVLDAVVMPKDYASTR